MKEAASVFLANKRIAVTGVSRKSKDHGSNTVFKRLRDRGYDVFAVNPNAVEVEGAPSYHDVKSIPGGVDAVVIATAPDKAEATMRECAELGIKQVWMIGPTARAASVIRPPPTGVRTASRLSTAVARSCSRRPRTSVTGSCGWCMPATSRRPFESSALQKTKTVNSAVSEPS